MCPTPESREQTDQVSDDDKVPWRCGRTGPDASTARELFDGEGSSTPLRESASPFRSAPAARFALSASTGENLVRPVPEFAPLAGHPWTRRPHRWQSRIQATSAFRISAGRRVGPVPPTSERSMDRNHQRPLPLPFA